MKAIYRWEKNPFWIRLLHWEYWSFNIVYLPIYPVFLFLCLRARSFFFFSASNPTIKNGGFLGESKRDIYQIVPAHLQPKTIFCPHGSTLATVLQKLNDNGLVYPLIGKPDIGGRGRGVKKINDEKMLSDFISGSEMNFHIQEFVGYENELGIFYYRMPDKENGDISGIVRKEFLKVCGDGRRTIRDLLMENSRGILQIHDLEIQEPSLLTQIPLPGEIVTVVPYGNHARGALFIDDTHTSNYALKIIMDQICKQIPDFYFGRLDIRFENRSLLEEGKSFSILEVNGAGSEPTHIYDPGHSIFFAWKEIIRHLVILYKISLTNHRLGHPYMTVREGIRMYLKNFSDSKKLKSMTSNKGKLTD
jgi:hypothetical protein